MSDLISAVGEAVSQHLGMEWAGQEPQDRDRISPSGLLIVERVGGGMTRYGRTDRPWIQFTILATSKKRAWDRLREVREYWSVPRARVGDHFIYNIREVLNPEDASLTADPFYRVRVSFAFHISYLA